MRRSSCSAHCRWLRGDDDDFTISQRKSAGHRAQPDRLSAAPRRTASHAGITWFNSPVPPATRTGAVDRRISPAAGRNHCGGRHRRLRRRPAFATLLEYGFAKASIGASDDGLTLVDCRIGNAVHCVPPQNKPLPVEINTCRQFLIATIASMPKLRAIVALGRIAHESTLKALGLRNAAAPFGHGAVHPAGAIKLYDSYHCSRYNTNTRVLTPEMFRSVFAKVKADLDS